MTDRVYGQATDAMATTVLRVVSGHLHDLADLAERLGRAAEQISLGDKNSAARRQLQESLETLHFTVQGMREPIRDFFVSDGTGMPPPVMLAVESLVNRLHKREPPSRWLWTLAMETGGTSVRSKCKQSLTTCALMSREPRRSPLRLPTQS